MVTPALAKANSGRTTKADTGARADSIRPAGSGGTTDGSGPAADSCRVAAEAAEGMSNPTTTPASAGSTPAAAMSAHSTTPPAR